MANVSLNSTLRTDNFDVQAMVGYVEPQDEKIVMYLKEPGKNNAVVTAHNVRVRDVRTAGVDCFNVSALDDIGFAFTKHNGTMDINNQVFADNKGEAMDASPYTPATLRYLDDVAQHIKSISGAREVLPQVRGLLSRASTRAGTLAFYKPASFAHIDYTPEYAENQIPLALKLAGAEAKPYSRFVLYQTWRAISKAPQDSTLAICDGRSASLSDDGPLLYTVLPLDIPDNVVHTRIPKYNPLHRWYYLSNMEPDDLLIFPAYDTAKPRAMNAMHVAFDNPLAGADAEPRRSIEARFVALFA